MHDHRWTASRRVAMQHGGRPMAQNENGIEARKSEHVLRCAMSRATTLSAVFTGSAESAVHARPLNVPLTAARVTARNILLNGGTHTLSVRAAVKPDVRSMSTSLRKGTFVL